MYAEKTPYLATAALLAGLITATGAQAAPFTFSYSDTASLATGITALRGEPMVISVVLDNGNDSLLSQTWSALDLVSLTLDVADGALAVTFSYPNPIAAGDLLSTDGNFETDALGNLIGVAARWRDISFRQEASGTVLNGPTFFNGWELGGRPGALASGDIALTTSGAAARYLDLTNWTITATTAAQEEDSAVPPTEKATAVPEPTTLALLGLGAIAARRRRR